MGKIPSIPKTVRIPFPIPLRTVIYTDLFSFLMFIQSYRKGKAEFTYEQNLQSNLLKSKKLLCRGF